MSVVISEVESYLGSQKHHLHEAFSDSAPPIIGPRIELIVVAAFMRPRYTVRVAKGVMSAGSCELVLFYRSEDSVLTHKQLSSYVVSYGVPD